MQKEKIGNLIDGVYAIALTLLVLDLPKPDYTGKIIGIFPQIGEVLTNYVFSFLLLFNFWINQSNINDLPDYHSRITLWLNGLALMFVCLIPYSTSLLHIHGKNPYIDLTYIINCLVIDLIIFLTLLVHRRDLAGSEHHLAAIASSIGARKYSTISFIIAIGIAMILPVPKKDVLFIVPLFLIFEDKIVIASQFVYAKIKKLTTK